MCIYVLFMLGETFTNAGIYYIILSHLEQLGVKPLFIIKDYLRQTSDRPELFATLTVLSCHFLRF
jgi:hypothetical protein